MALLSTFSNDKELGDRVGAQTIAGQLHHASIWICTIGRRVSFVFDAQRPVHHGSGVSCADKVLYDLEREILRDWIRKMSIVKKKKKDDFSMLDHHVVRFSIEIFERTMDGR